MSQKGTKISRELNLNVEYYFANHESTFTESTGPSVQDIAWSRQMHQFYKMNLHCIINFIMENQIIDET